MISFLRQFHIWSLAILLLLSGCGFHLKGYHQASPNLDGLFVEQGEQRATLAGVIRRELSVAGVKLAGSPALARNRLRITQEQFGRRVISVDANGKVLEYELRLDAGFEVLAATGGKNLPVQILELTRQLTLSDADELGQRNEAALMRGDMRLDMAGQIIRRLQAQLK
ncbi:MAG: LPS assembly lipoprotein LptE [Pseudomonadota bacterium]